MSMDRFREIFYAESAELLADMEARLLAFEEGVYNRDALDAIFRCAHSIKGGAGAFGMERVTQFTHLLEALLENMRDGSERPTRENIDLLLRSVDIVTQLLAAEKSGIALSDEIGRDIRERLSHYAMPSHAPIASTNVSSEASYSIRFAPHASLLATGNEPLLILRELTRLGEASIVADCSKLPAFRALNATECHLAWDITLHTNAGEAAIHDVFEFVNDIADITVTPLATRTEPVASSKSSEDVRAITTGSIRVDLDKVDKLVNMVGELVITEAMLRAQARHLPANEFNDLLRGIEELSHHTRELQEAVMSVRMQPVKSVFSRMPRIVRDTAAQLGKDIQLVTLGEQTEVDKTVIEQLTDPLTHMIRNAVDHGIESPEARKAAGKPEQGTIRLSAFHRSGRIVIEVSDDGAGIDRARVLAKAREKGLLEAAASLSDEEIDQLIFLPGFSTAEQVTNVSGRGVGMDVVKRNIAALGGTVRVSNQPGTGAVFTVSLPLTLAILDGMIVRVGAEHYIVPITSIIESLQPKAGSIFTVGGDNHVIDVRGELIPLVYLHRVFGVAEAEQDASRALTVLVESNQQKAGLVVDELIGQQQVVIKSLEANADPVAGVSGATILGDGKVSLILEINELCTLAMPGFAQDVPPKVA